MTNTPKSYTQARKFIEEWVDVKLGVGKRPCGWPNFGAISVDEVARILIAFAEKNK